MVLYTKTVYVNCLQQWVTGRYRKFIQNTDSSNNTNIYMIPIFLIFIYGSARLFRFTDEDVDEMYREAPIKNGMFDYTEFTRILKHGAKEKDEA